MIAPRHPVNAFVEEAGVSAGLTVRTRRDSVSLTRLQRSADDGIAIGAPAEDAHIVVYQVRPHPSHLLWLDGAAGVTGDIERGGTNILDLRAAPTALLGPEVDSLHLRIPKTALEDLATDADRCIHGLHACDGWSTLDPMMSRLEPLIIEVLKRAGPAERLLVDHLVLSLCAHVADTYGLGGAIRAHKGGLAPWQVKRAKEIIASDLAAETPLVEIAAACGLSAAHFARSFKASTGMTPHGWLQACRLDRARALLDGRALRISRVASESGFSDQSHMSRVFKRAMGMSPRAYARLRGAGSAL
ncbi:helix-turn-helix transcriptional regulator [Caulobacter segnis]|uniref:Transcriptional regulator, AraC family n=1 Tax=Caulobacter segnis (strain ATCC 21756 / DSM 7131 / JCM 7823 / NBRC 15250 / LMG 17158 / TK0059) TaxID=509190 RepID=D5VLX9_CAUST|nr:AraC family transcriptional regulator [Caulobacter segnis]ADG11502.1 transcriptional regulator, AraC family [Caulobacter segnis ATCC 21756]